MTKPTAQTGLTCCAVKTAHRLEFTRVEVEEILRLSARKAAASTAQARIARRLSRPDGLACGRAGQTDRHATWPSGTPCAATTLFISPPCFRRGGPAYGAFACWEGDLRAPPTGSVQARSSLTAPRFQGGRRAINAIAVWLALRNAASSAEMQSGKLAASAFADGRTRKDRNSGYPG